MRYGTMGVDFEERVNFERLRKERLDKGEGSPEGKYPRFAGLL